jgi:hypothetical protein
LVETLSIKRTVGLTKYPSSLLLKFKELIKYINLNIDDKNIKKTLNEVITNEVK